MYFESACPINWETINRSYCQLMLALIDNIPLFRIRLYLYLHELYLGDLSVVFNIL